MSRDRKSQIQLYMCMIKQVFGMKGALIMLDAMEVWISSSGWSDSKCCRFQKQLYYIKKQLGRGVHLVL